MSICFENVIVKISIHPLIIFLLRIGLSLHSYNRINSKVRSRRLLGPSTVVVRFSKKLRELKLIIYPDTCYNYYKKSIEVNNLTITLKI